MPWNESPPAEASVRSVLIPSLISLCLAAIALCLPPAALAAVGLAWWCWWICGRDAAIRGFGWTLAALAASHAVLLIWLLLLAILLDGHRGLTLASLAVLAYLLICVAVTRSSAWKYAIVTFALSAVAGSLVWNAIYAARYDAQNNLVKDSLRQLGIGRQWIEQQDSGVAESVEPVGLGQDARGLDGAGRRPPAIP